MARKPVLEVVAGVADERDEPIGACRPEVVGDESEGEGAGVGRLGVRGGGAVVGEELGAPRVGDVRGEGSA